MSMPPRSLPGPCALQLAKNRGLCCSQDLLRPGLRERGLLVSQAPLAGPLPGQRLQSLLRPFLSWSLGGLWDSLSCSAGLLHPGDRACTNSLWLTSILVFRWTRPVSPSTRFLLRLSSHSLLRMLASPQWVPCSDPLLYEKSTRKESLLHRLQLGQQLSGSVPAPVLSWWQLIQFASLRFIGFTASLLPFTTNGSVVGNSFEAGK